MLTRIYADRLALRNGGPAVRVERGGEIRNCREVTIRGADGQTLARVIQSDEPIANGVRVWLETERAVEVR